MRGDLEVSNAAATVAGVRMRRSGAEGIERERGEGGTCSARGHGTVKLNVAPRPGAESTSMTPSWS